MKPRKIDKWQAQNEVAQAQNEAAQAQNEAAQAKMDIIQEWVITFVLMKIVQNLSQKHMYLLQMIWTKMQGL